MRRLVVSLLVVAFAVGLGTRNARAGISLSAFAGVDAARFETSNQVVDVAARFGYCVGGSITVSLLRRLAVVGELAYVSRGARIRLAGTETDFQLAYVQTPVLGRFYFSGGLLRPYIYAGTNLAMKVQASATSTFEGATSMETLDSVRTVDVGLLIGGGINLDVILAGAYINIGYYSGASQVFEGEGHIDAKNRGFGLTAGISFL